MGGGANREHLNFVMACITKTKSGKRFVMLEITICNGLHRRRNLDGQHLFCHKHCVSRLEPGAPPKGSSWPVGCYGAVVNTGFQPRSRRHCVIMRARPLPIIAFERLASEPFPMREPGSGTRM